MLKRENFVSVNTANATITERGESPHCQPSIYKDIMENPFRSMVSAGDLAEASRIAGSSRVYAVLRPTETCIKKFTQKQFPQLLNPCFWLWTPCLVPAFLAVRNRFRHSLYIVTEDAVYISVQDHPVTCGWCIKMNDNFTKILLEDIVHVFVEDKCRDCDCCPVAYATLNLGNKLVNLLVENPHEVVHIINQLREARRNSQPGYGSLTSVTS